MAAKGNAKNIPGKGITDQLALPSGRATLRSRAEEVVRAAYELIAERGMEGLRTRDVAERVGINSATLHYYFPTKESLVQGVVDFLMRELRASRAEPKGDATALELLRAEFEDIRMRLKDSPDQLVVLTELAVRGWRDPVVATMLSHLDQGWRGHLVSVLERGVRAGEFRKDLDVLATANAMMIQLRGLGYHGKHESSSVDEVVRQITRQVERWVLREI